jgi:diguanylate cyclase (GGDEF)-like protein
VALPEMVADGADDGTGWWSTAGREPGEPTCARLLVRVRQEREFLTAVLRHIPAGVAIVDAASRRLLFRNAQADAILGPPGPGADDVLAAYRDLCPMHADGRPYVEAELPLVRALAGEVVVGEEIHLSRGAAAAAGDAVVVQVAATPIRDGHGRVMAAVLVLEDVTARKAAQARVARLALHDPLTGLPNRALFQDRLAQALARARRTGDLGEGEQVAVMLLDLDGFKDVNDALGHETGDRLLQAVAARLAPIVRASDTLARLGGDEFALVQAGVRRSSDAAALAGKLLRRLAKPCELDGHAFHVSASLGIALFPRDGENPETLLRHADLALYRAKAEGRGAFRCFEPGMDAAARARRRLEGELRVALERKEFVLHYQPQLDLHTGRFTGAEALVRWHHPERGLVMPGAFVPLAEATGLIRPLGEWVLREACRQAAAWRAAGLPPLTVAVNLSPTQLRDADLPGMVARVLRRRAGVSLRLELEITETVLMETLGSEAGGVLARLVAGGVELAIDDFGTGYSSLSYLKQLPARSLKIDRAFVAGLGVDAADTVLVRSMVEMAHGLGKRVVAEGVETETQLAFLRALGCDAAQGFLLARPQPAEDVSGLLARPWR